MELLCVGNALIDGFAVVDEAFFDRFALHEPVQHLDYSRVESILDAITDISLYSGGGSATVAKVAARLGTPSSFVGAIGTKNQEPDTHGRLFMQELAFTGVKTFLSYKPVPTGICLILNTKSSGQSRIVACPSAALQFMARDIPQSLYHEARLMVLDGYMLGRTDFVHEVLAAARRRAMLLALDTGSVANVERYAQDIIRYCSEYRLILFMNEPESIAFCPDFSEAKREEFFTALSAQRAFPIIVVKLGDRGVYVCSGGVLER
ncbi:MAG: carbohydrate kinase family protein, partial [Spirochaetaceae bacterium]|nr:carbohydrate kinase family protein [Spirochaetaceae bacterium]